MDFGLGLILSFTDNATSGINNAVNSLNQLTRTAEGASSSLNSMASLSALSVVSDQMGNAFVQAGSSMVGVLTNLLGQTMEVGSNFENFGITLNQLYGDATKANEALDKLLVYGAKTPFEVDDIKDMLVVLKSQGIDAFETIQGSVSGLNQETLSWLGDIMAFKPDIPAERWKLAFTNFLGSGQAKVLENALDMGKIADSIGHEVGDTAEERLKSLVEFAEKNNISGLMSEMFGTWTQVTSNMSDIWTMFVKKVSDAGVFENLKGAMGGLSTAIAELDEAGHLDTLAEAIASGLNLLIAPVTYLSGKLSDLIAKIGELSATNPEIVKFGTVFLGAAGVAMIAVGVFLKAVSALSGLSLMLMTMGKSFSDIGALFAAGTSRILGVLAPFAIAVGAFILAWKTDFAGIKTFTVKAFNGILTAFSTARTAVNGSLDDMLSIISGFDKHSFFDNLTLAIMKLMILGRALVEGWNNYTLSDDTFQKMEALGLKPLVSRMFDLLYRFREFKQGFIEGWTEVGNRVKEVISGIMQSLDGTIFDSLFEGARKFFELLTNNDPSAWRQFGTIIGEVAAHALIMFTVFKAFDWVIGKVGTVIGIFTTLFGIIGRIIGIFGNLGGIAASIFPHIAGLIGGIARVVSTVITAFGDLFSFITGGFTVPTQLGQIFINVFNVIRTVITGIISFFGTIGATASAIIVAAVASVVTFIVTQKEKFLSMVSDLWEHIKTVFSGVKERFMQVVSTVSSLIAPVIELVKGAINNLKEAFSSFTGSETVQVVISALVRALSFLGEIIVGTVFPVLKMLASFIGGALKAAFDVIGGVISGVVTTIGTLFAGLVNVISGIVNIISGIIDTIGGLIKGIVTRDFSLFFDGLSNIGQGIMQVLGGIVEAIGGVIIGVVEALSGIVVGVFDLGVSIVQGLINGIGSFLGNAVTAIIDLGKSIIDAFKSLFGINSPSTVFEGFGANLVEGLLQGITNLWNSITSFFTSALAGIQTIFTTAWDAIKNVVSTALTAIQTVITTIWTAISTVVMTIVSGIQNFISAAWNTISSVVSTVMSTIFSIVSSIWNSILSVVSSVVNGILSVVTSVWNTITSAISTAMSTISSTISSMWSSIVSAIQGFMSNIVSAIMNGFNQAKSFITGLAGEAFSWGSDIVSNIANGIRSAIGQVASAVSSVASKIRSFLHFSVPDEGPLTDFESWMPDFMQGLANSIMSSSDIVIQAITQFTTQVKTALTTDLLQSLQQVTVQWTQGLTQLTQSTQQLSVGVTQSFVQIGTGIAQVARQVITIFIEIGNTARTAFTGMLTIAQQVTTQMGTGFTTATTTMTTSFTQTTAAFGTMMTTMQTGYATLQTTVTTTMNTMVTATTTAMNQLETAVQTAMSRAVTAVQTAVGTMKAAMNFQWSLPHLKVPHVSVSGSFNLNPPSAPKFSVSWYGKGGVFDAPSVIGVGEQGAEAVMPLENNTEWIGILATEIGNRISAANVPVTPASTQQVSNTNNTGNTSYMTNTVGATTNTDNSSHDNHVEFQPGAIVIQVMNASAEEAERLAVIIMEKIKRKQELERMASYAT